ncbi:type IV secretion system protein [Erythrobacter aureus]|uniref:Type IV secretion system protein n=1 Tax=Erythrobacter aureus TaxID=2182384 RepID=A0A345YIK9_9SPHN|nr:type IV secretion system protein [Erythrobacter aureus]AXK43761.1 hypothetical protein DVR09_14990 [Erythrobacter aureus]
MRRILASLFVAFALVLSVVSPAPAYAQEEPPSWWDWDMGGEDAEPKKSLAEWKETFSAPSACWGCELYSAMATVTMDIGQKGEALFTGSAINAMSAFMGLWVVFQLYLLMSPSFANGPAQSIDTIFQRLVLMVILLFVLSAGPYGYIMEGFVFPAINGTMGAANALIGGGGSCGGGGGNPLAVSGSQLICSMHIEMGKGIGLGVFLIDDAEMNFFTGNFEIFQIIGGLVIALCFGLMMVMLPFRLFDAMIRLAVVSVILPVIVLAYQFKPTRGACKQAATSCLTAGLTFLFTAVAVAISVQLLSIVASPVIDSATDTSTNSYIGPLDGKAFMVLVAAACGMAAFIKSAGTLAAEFAGFQGSSGGVGGGAATGFAAGAAGTAVVSGYAGKKLVSAGRAAATGGSSLAFDGAMKAGRATMGASAAAGRAAGGADMGGR